MLNFICTPQLLDRGASGVGKTGLLVWMLALGRWSGWEAT
ncbi:unnamed protein product [Linum tenue]|uniref:Uncharacterized protein n=1 Tax=Linum tenue TaxID=586396 RepID=A0AAV0JYE7_9ROSI|nr:unnamed protein product [Linum tenue]